MKGYSDEVYSSVTQRESSSQTLLHKNEDRDWGIIMGVEATGPIGDT